MGLAKDMGIVMLALQEAVLKGDVTRRPEPSSEMDVQEQIEGFHDAGKTSLMPIYHFNARAINAMAPRGAHIVDLGSGSARFLSYLADCRPDLQITGIELSPGMVKAGQKLLVDRGMAERVTIVPGDMRHFRGSVDRKIDLVTSVFSLHHLPTPDDLVACVQEMTKAVLNDRAQLWIFDFARPKRESTARRFPEVFTPDDAPAFKLDTSNSLTAAWSFNELQGVLRRFIPGGVNSSLTRLLPLYQLHCLGAERPKSVERLWRDNAKLSRHALRDAERLSRLFPWAPRRQRI